MAATRDGVQITDLDGNEVGGRSYHVDWDVSAAEKGGHPYFMLKEISEQPAAFADTLRGRLSADGGIVLDEERLAARTSATSTRCSSSPAAPPTTPA